MSVPLVDLRAQYDRIRPEVDAAILDVVGRADFILGSAVDEFERAFAELHGVEHCVALDSGISALELGMRALDIGPGDEVITPAHSFIASSSAISFTGATPAWVDVERDTGNLDAAAVEAAITPRTRAIMPVHLYGQPADMDAVLEVAARHGLPVVEDACQAHDAAFAGRKAGSMGAFGAFSFYPGKNLGAYGDAGALTTNDAALAERVRMMRNYGQRKKYDHVTLAWNRRMDTIQAAVLNVKLPHLPGWSEARRRVADQYDELLAGLPVTLPARRPGRDHVFHLYVIEAEDRDGLLGHLHERGIGAGIHYPVPIHLQEAYAERGFGPGSFPAAEALAARVLSLPMYPEMTDAQVAEVATAVRDFFPA